MAYKPKDKYNPVGIVCACNRIEDMDREELIKEYYNYEQSIYLNCIYSKTKCAWHFEILTKISEILKNKYNDNLTYYGRMYRVVTKKMNMILKRNSNLPKSKKLKQFKRKQNVKQ